MTTETDMDALWGDDVQGGGAVSAGHWFTRDRYSMFIHWGLYSHLGGQWKGENIYGIGEWIMDSRMAGIPVEEYKALAQEFRPAEFDATAIVQLAKKAGMRCIVFTAKHHEGFAMYDSQVSEFTITKATSFGRDPLAELSEACKKEGIRLGFYYSQNLDWTEPDGGGSNCEIPEGFEPDFDRYFEAKAFPQVKELLSNYGEISVVWFDTPGKMPATYSQRLVDLVHELQPGCLVNSRVGNGLGDYSTLGDMELPTKTPGEGMFECVDTTNDSWAYSAMDSNWKSPTLIVQNVIRTIARGCSYMLNIGPDGKGVVPAPAVEALENAGEWVRTNQEALVGVTASPFPPFAWGDCTVKENILYVHLFPGMHRDQLQFGGLGCRVLECSQLMSGRQVPVTQTEGVVRLDLSEVADNGPATVLKLVCQAPPVALHGDLCVSGDDPVVLLAEYATLKNVELKTARWMETFGAWKKAEHLEGWEGPPSTATWHVEVIEPAPFTVSIEYACGQANEGTEWLLQAGEEKMLFSALPTGQNPDVRRMRYVNVTCGMIHFRCAGRQTLTLSPVQPKGAIAVKSVTLTPWK